MVAGCLTLGSPASCSLATLPTTQLSSWTTLAYAAAVAIRGYGPAAGTLCCIAVTHLLPVIAPDLGWAEEYLHCKPTCDSGTSARQRDPTPDPLDKEQDRPPGHCVPVLGSRNPESVVHIQGQSPWQLHIHGVCLMTMMLLQRDSRWFVSAVPNFPHLCFLAKTS